MMVEKKMVKHPLFESLGERYPQALEERFDRILTKIEELWETDQIDDYFSDLIIDKRGGRQGFPKDVLDDIIMLRDLRESEVIRRAERKEDAARELDIRGFKLKDEEFFRAIEDGNKVLVDLFVRAGFNIHKDSEEGTPPLLIALKNGYTVIAHILLNAGADVNARDSMGLTPLLMACGKPARGYKDVAEILINKGANINVHDRLGYTPLLLAVSGGTVDIAEILIKRGANVSAKNKYGETALSLAEKNGHQAIAKLLVEMGAARN
jgi:ankyrin repeat protein